MPAVVHELLGEAAKDHPLPDEEIVRRVVAGEKALYEVLMRRHNQKLYRAVFPFHAPRCDRVVAAVFAAIE
jgi:hypothetical protein